MSDKLFEVRAQLYRDPVYGYTGWYSRFVCSTYPGSIAIA
jgi:hypothetical protein